MDTERLSNKKGKRFKKSKKKTNKKKIILVMLVVLIIVGLGFYFSKNIINLKVKKQRETSKEISAKLLEEKQYKEMKIKDISLKVDESASYFRCNIENTTDKKFNQEEVLVVFVKEDSSELARFKYHIEEIESKAEENISVTTTSNLAEAYDFYIEQAN